VKLTIIGHWGGFPKAHEASSGYLLEHEQFQLLIDCGSGVLSFLQDHIPCKDIDAVVISHYHADHIADIGVLQHALLIDSFLGKVRSPLNMYGHDENKAAFSEMTYKQITKGIAYDPTKTLQVGPFEIEFLKTIHPVPCYAMKIKAGDCTLVYTADSSYQEAFILFADQADVLLCESNFYADMDGSKAGHMTSKEAGYIAQKSGVKKLILTHLPHFGDLNELKLQAEAEFDGPVLLAEKDKVVII
jgi:ribonuclease BN (tRNA processing enzyme)